MRKSKKKRLTERDRKGFDGRHGENSASDTLLVVAVYFLDSSIHFFHCWWHLPQGEQQLWAFFMGSIYLPGEGGEEEAFWGLPAIQV